MSKYRYLLFFLITVLVIAGLALISPQEKSLGENVRIVYIHGAWVLAAEATLLVSGLTGLLALFLRRETPHRWSRALGWSGMFFWLTYLPSSLWAMQANWSGLFLAEPRFRLALTFAIVGLLLQAGLWLIHKPWLTSLSNLFFIVTLRVAFSSASYILHPPALPIFASGLLNVQVFFIGLTLLSLLAAYLLTRFFINSTPAV